MSAEPQFATPGDKNALEEGDLFSPRFDAHGLIPCVTVDAASRQVLMVAWMNAEALKLTIETGQAHYWSRSRGEIWRKGATSGATQAVVEMRTDCDQDTLLLKVRVESGPEATCHTGRHTCFYRTVALGGPANTRTRLHFAETDPAFDPDSPG